VDGLRTSRKLLGGGFRIPPGDDCTRPAEINVARRQTDKTIGIARRHVADATAGDDYRIVARTKQVIEVLQGRNLLEQLALGIRTEFLQTGRGDLKMKSAA